MTLSGRRTDSACVALKFYSRFLDFDLSLLLRNWRQRESSRRPAASGWWPGHSASSGRESCRAESRNDRSSSLTRIREARAWHRKVRDLLASYILVAFKLKGATPVRNRNNIVIIIIKTSLLALRRSYTGHLLTHIDLYNYWPGYTHVYVINYINFFRDVSLYTKIRPKINTGPTSETNPNSMLGQRCRNVSLWLQINPPSLKAKFGEHSLSVVV